MPAGAQAPPRFGIPANVFRNRTCGSELFFTAIDPLLHQGAPIVTGS